MSFSSKAWATKATRTMVTLGRGLSSKTMDKKLTCSKSRPGHFKTNEPCLGKFTSNSPDVFQSLFIDSPDLIPSPAIWFLPLFIVSVVPGSHWTFCTKRVSNPGTLQGTNPYPYISHLGKGNASDSDSDHMLQTQGNGYVNSQQGNPTTELPPSEAILNVSRVVNQCR